MLDIYQEYSNHIQKIFENSLDYIYLHDKNGAIIDVNDLVIKNLGYSKEEILKLKVTDFLVEEIISDIITEINETMRTGIVNKPKTYKVRKKNGDFVFVEVNTIPLRRNGKIYAILGIGHDVSAYKKVEQNLIVSEKKYRHLFNQSPFSISVYDSEGNLIESNSILAQKLSTYTGIDFKGKNFIEIASHFQNSKQIIQIFSERLKELRQGEDLNPIEFFITTMNGEKIWLHWQSSRLEIDNHSYIQVIIQDITERKKAGAQLKESEENYRLLSENTDDLIVVYDSDLSVIYSNEETHSRVLGYSSEKLRDLIFRTSLIHEDDLNRTGELFKEGFQIGKFKQQIRIKHKDGHYLWFETKGRTFTDKEEKIKMLAVSRDITEIKSTEDKLIESQKSFQVLFNNSTSGIAYHKIVYDQNKNPTDYIITDINPKYEEILQLKKEDVINKKSTEVYHVNRAPYLDFYSEVADTGKAISFETYFTPLDRYFSISVISPKKEEFISVFDDISERKKAEFRLKKQSEELSTLNRIITLGNESTSLQEFLRKSYDQVLDIAGFDRGGVYLYDPDTHHNKLIHHKNVHPDFVAAVEDVDISEGLFNKIFDKEVPFYVEDFSVFMENSKDLGVYSAVIVPLRSKDEYVGSLNLASPVHQELSQNEFDLLIAIGKQMGIIIQKFESEKLLLESEEKFRTLFEKAEEGIILAETETEQILFANNKICEMLGYPLKELRNLCFADLHPKESLYYIDEKFEQELDEISMVNDIPMKRKDGSIFYCNVNSSEIEIAGKPYFLGLFRDITNRRQAEKSLKSERDKLQAFIESVPIGITISNPEGYFSEVNSTALEIFGYDTKEEFFRISAIDLFHDPKERDKFLELHKKGPILNFEFLSKSKLGTLDWCLLNSISHTIGNETMFFNSYLDINYRKKAEEALRESEEKFRSIAEHSDAQISIIQDGVFKYINQKTLDTVGYTTEEVELWKPNELFEKIVHPNQREIVIRLVERIQSGDKDYMFHDEIQFLDKFGKDLWLDMYSRSITFQGRPAVLNCSLNISDKKRAEEELRESEEKFRTITEQSFMGIIVLQDDVFKYINERATEIYGYSIEEISNWKPNEFVKLFHPDDKEFVMNQAQRKQAGVIDVVNQYQYRIIKKNGEIFWLENFSKTINYQGKPADLVMIIDITEKIKSEQKIKESEKILKDFIYNATDSISIWDSNLNLIEMNEIAVDPWTATKRAETGMNMLEMSPSIKETRRYDKYIEVIKTGEPVSFDNVRIPPNTGERYFNIKSFKVGNGIGIIGSEITERIRFEQELKESEEKFRNIAEQSFMGIVIIQDGKFKYMNKALGDMSQYPVEEMLTWSDKDLVKMIHPDDIEYIIKRLQSNKEGTMSQLSKNSFRIVNKSGEIRWLEDYTSKIIYQGKEANLISVIDVTDKKQAEQLIIEENKRLLELEELRKDLITRVSHELKTPMTSIFGTIQILLSIFREKMDKDTLKYVNIGYRGCLRLKELIENLLDTSRLESKKFELKLQKEDLALLIDDCVNDMAYLADTRQQTIEINAPYRIDFEIDRLRFRQVITNIISNAIKNTPREGNIIINLSEVDDYIDIQVKDNGVGLTQKEQERLFEKFGKIERYGMDFDVDIEGSGLGLYISKEIVELHGGQILLESEGRNKGATFIIRLFKS